MNSFKTAQPLHNESIQFLQSQKRGNLKRYAELSVEDARTQFSSICKDVAEEVDYDGKRQEYFVPSSDVRSGVPVYVYVPTNHSSNPPVIVYYHGGGNVLGSRDTVDVTCKKLSSGAKCIVVNVEYRLAPEHKFPSGVNDSCQVAKWILENKERIGGGPASKVGVAGDSAGGQIAATVAHDVPGITFQILIYPHLSARGDRSLQSYEEYKEGPILDRDLLDWFESKTSDVSDWTNPRLANLLRDKFDHLPPCLFIVAECDPLRDDSYEYARKLTAAGVHKELHLAKGAIHAFFTLSGAFKELSHAATVRTIDFIKTWGTA